MILHVLVTIKLNNNFMNTNMSTMSILFILTYYFL